MSATIEERLREHYAAGVAGIPDHGPGLDRVVATEVDRPAAPAQRSRRAIAVVGAAACIAVAIGGVLTLRSHDESNRGVSPEESDAPPSTPFALEPAVTLPPRDDVANAPVTVDVGSPASWYRLQPDLEFSWQSVDDASTQLCWRTPVESECALDEALPDPFTIASAGGQTMVVVIGDRATTPTLEVALSDGSIAIAPIAWDDAIDWGVARFELSDGATIVDAGRATATSSEQIVVSGATLPPGVDLANAPVTTPEGSELSYWRFMPDLDIAERQRDDGTELCWRTPAGEGCIDDSFLSPDVGVIPTDGGVIVLARPALIRIEPPPTDPLEPTHRMGPMPTEVIARLSDGSVVRADVRVGVEYGVGYARLDLGVGLSISSIRSA